MLAVGVLLEITQEISKKKVLDEFSRIFLENCFEKLLKSQGNTDEILEDLA